MTHEQAMARATAAIDAKILNALLDLEEMLRDRGAAGAEVQAELEMHRDIYSQWRRTQLERIDAWLRQEVGLA